MEVILDGVEQSLLNDFAKVVNKKEETNVSDKYLRGTVKIINDRKYVGLDGSNVLTPISTVAKVKEGERVLATIENHTAIVMGNLSSPSASDKEVLQINEKVTETGKLLAHRVVADELDVIKGIIDNLSSKIANIENADIVNAEIEKLKAKYAELDYVSANDVKALNADIENIKAVIGEFTDISTEDLEVINAEIENLKGKNAEFTYVSADNFEALKAKIDNLEVGNLEATYAKIDMSNVSVENVGKLFVDSGLLKDVTIVDGHVTGDLTGVRIHGDLIDTNTLKVKNLLLEGPDGLIYQINALASGLTQTELTEEIYNQKMLGSVLVNQSVTTEQLNTKEIFSNSAVIKEIFAQDVTATGTVTGMTFKGGSININEKFIVDSLGNMKSINGEFSGKIDALSGTIGGFLIKDNSLETDTLKTIEGALDRKQFILDTNKNVIFFRSYRPDNSDIEYGPGEELRISHKGFEMEYGTYGGKIDGYMLLDYESVAFDGDMVGAHYGVYGINIYDTRDMEKGTCKTSIDINGIVTDGYIKTSQGLYTGGKTGATDGKTGGALGTNGYLHLVADKSRNNPGISFYYDMAKSATHQLTARQNDFYFNRPVAVNGTIRINNSTVLGTYNSKGTAGNLIYCSNDDRIIIGTSSIDVYGNMDIYAGDFMRFHTNSNSTLYKATVLELFREQSENHRTILRPASNGGAYLGTQTYCWNTVWYSNALTKSDLKEKDVIEDFDFKVKDFIMGLEPIAYHLKSSGSNGKRIHIGLGAQTLAKHIKDLKLGDLSMVQASIIDGENEKSYHGEDIDDSKLSWSINYTELTPYLILIIQDHETRIRQLEKENIYLKEILINNN